MPMATATLERYDDTNKTSNRSVRPVINLVKNIEMTGTGTVDDPYRMVE